MGENEKKNTTNFTRNKIVNGNIIIIKKYDETYGWFGSQLLAVSCYSILQ